MASRLHAVPLLITAGKRCVFVSMEVFREGLSALKDTLSFFASVILLRDLQLPAQAVTRSVSTTALKVFTIVKWIFAAMLLNLVQLFSPQMALSGYKYLGLFESEVSKKKKLLAGLDQEIESVDIDLPENARERLEQAQAELQKHSASFHALETFGIHEIGYYDRLKTLSQTKLAWIVHEEL